MTRIAYFCALLAVSSTGILALLLWPLSFGAEAGSLWGMQLPGVLMLLAASVSLALLVRRRPSTGWIGDLLALLPIAAGLGFLLASDEFKARYASPGLLSWSLALAGASLLTLRPGRRNLLTVSWICGSLAALLPIQMLYTWIVCLVSASGTEPASSGSMILAVLTLVTIVGTLYANPAWRGLNYLASRGPEGRLMRRLIPMTLGGPLLLSMTIATRFESSTVNSAITLGLIAAMLAVVTSLAAWTFAIYLANVDAARRRALAELEESHDTLEERVRVATAGLANANRALLAQVQATREAQGEFESLFFSAPDAILVVRPNGEIQMANERACLLFGYSRSQLLELRVEDLMPTGVRASHVLLRENYLIDPVPRIMSAGRQVEALRRDGSKIFVEISLSPLGRGGRPDVIAMIRDVTDLRRARESLSLSEMRFSETFEHAPIGMAIIDLNGGWLEVNSAFCLILGRTRDEVMAASFADVTHPDDLLSDREYIKQLWRGEISSYEIERRYRRKDDTVVWGLVRVSLLRNRAGEPQQYIAQVVDISPLKGTQQALINSRARLQRVLNGSSDGFWDLNLVSDDVEASDRFYRILGFLPGERPFDFTGFASACHPDDVEHMRSAIVDHVKGRSDHIEVEFRMRHRNGSWVWVLARGKVYERDMSGRPSRMAGTITDVTVRHRMESAMRERERLLRAVLEALPTSVLIADSRGTVTASNPAADKFWKGAQHVGIDGYDAFHGWWADSGAAITPHDWALARAIEQRETSRDEVIEIETAEGQRKTILNFATPITDDRGQLEGAISVAQDITHVMQLQKDLLRRTRELEESNKELEQFAYAASHDLQEPLRKITSFVQLFARRYSGKVDVNAQEYIDIIVEGAQRMKSLIDDLLRYSRVTGGERAFTAVDLQQVLSGVRKDLELQLTETRAVIDAESLPMVTGDSSQLRALFQNLISNAIKFRSERVPRIEIRCRRDGMQYVVSVRDNGIGIDPKYFERIFVLFQRLHTRAEYPGSGIGLAICKKIVERHGGRVWVESTPSEGATFYFTLPVRTGENGSVESGGALRN
jgi:PAS domain S-box-containing protein